MTIPPLYTLSPDFFSFSFFSFFKLFTVHFLLIKLSQPLRGFEHLVDVVAEIPSAHVGDLLLLLLLQLCLDPPLSRLVEVGQQEVDAHAKHDARHEEDDGDVVDGHESADHHLIEGLTWKIKRVSVSSE